MSGADAEPLHLPSVLLAAAVAQERRMYVTKADTERFGLALSRCGCGCISVGGRAVVPHHNECKIPDRDWRSMWGEDIRRIHRKTNMTGPQ